MEVGVAGTSQALKPEVCAATYVYVEDTSYGTALRSKFVKERQNIQKKYANLPSEFDDDDMNETLDAQDKKRGWYYPLTKTEQKKEFGYVVAEQQRFLWHLQDGHLDIVEDYLLHAAKRKAIEVNAYDELGWTPLHYAARLNFPEIVRVLLDANADPDLKDKVNGMTASDLATMGFGEEAGSNEEVLEVLRGAI